MNDRRTELKEHSAHIFEMGCMEQRVYLKNDADAVIEAKDAEIAKMNAKIEELKAKNAQLEDDVAFWKKKLSSCLNGDCILTCDTVEKYGKENVRLKRALWLAQGNGEVLTLMQTANRNSREMVETAWRYFSGECNEEVDYGFEGQRCKGVCKWDDEEWHTPDVEYMGITDEVNKCKR